MNAEKNRWWKRWWEKDFVLSISISLGISILFYIVTNYFKQESFKILEILGIFVSLFLASYPIINLKNKYVSLFTKLKRIEKIENKIYSDIDILVNALDDYNFKPDRHHHYLKILEELNNTNSNFFRKSFLTILEKWKKKGTKPERDLTLLLYNHILLFISEFENENKYIVPLKTYLDFLLNIIEIGFRIDNNFYFYSYTNALPDSWFDANNIELAEYRKKFVELLEEFKDDKNKNILKRFVITYDIKNEEKKNNIYSVTKYEEKWKGLTNYQKDIYINKFIKNKESYLIKLHPDFVFTEGFTELIYFGGNSDEDSNSPKWKWALKGEYIESSKSMYFYLHSFGSNDDNDIDIGCIIPTTNNTVTDKLNHYSQSNKISIKISQFPGIIDETYNNNCPYKIGNNENVFQCKKIKKNDTNNETTNE